MFLCFFRQKKKSILVRTIRKTLKDIQKLTLILIIYVISLQALSDKFLRFPLNIRSLRPNRTRNNTHLAKSKRNYFWFAPPPTHGPEQLDLSRGLLGGDGNRSNWTMHNHLISNQQEWNNCLIKIAHKIHEPFYPGYQMFLLLSLLSQSLLVFFLYISRAQTMHLERQSLKSVILFIHWAPFWGFAQIPARRSFESLS